MEPHTISDKALEKLRDVADWFQEPGIEVKTISANMSKCIDPARSSKLAPFLVELGHRDKVRRTRDLLHQSTNTNRVTLFGDFPDHRYFIKTPASIIYSIPSRLLKSMAQSSNRETFCGLWKTRL
jgi:hypothetical protein